MIVLGIETAGPRGSVALLRSDGSPVQIEFQASGRLGAELAPAIQRLLRKNGLGALNPPDLVAVDTGPGSYTGLRIGLAAAKGLAFAWSRPLIGIPAVEALSAEAPPSAERVLCALDASRGQVYAVLYTRSGERVERRAFDELIAPEALTASLTNRTFVIGDAAPLVTGDHERAHPDQAWPTALRIAELAYQRHMEGERHDAMALMPVYYRPNEAEERRRKRRMRGDA